MHSSQAYVQCVLIHASIGTGEPWLGVFALRPKSNERSQDPSPNHPQNSSARKSNLLERLQGKYQKHDGGFGTTQDEDGKKLAGKNSLTIVSQRIRDWRGVHTLL